MKHNLLLIVILFFAKISLGQTILFSENFDSCTLDEKWTFTLEGNQNVAWGVGIPTNPKAEGLSINGTCCLYIDDDLTGDKTLPFKLRVYSSYFDGSDFSDLLFKAQVHFRRDKTEVMNIYIDNGKEEILIRQFKDRNFSGAKFNEFVEMNTDISFYASDSMRIIIEYDDDNQWGWWAGIDNIVVSGSQTGKIVLGQTFNECTKPINWQTEILNGVDDWQFGIFTGGRTIDGTCFVFFNDDILGKEAPLSKIRLYSPYFKGDEYGTYTLIYDFIYRTYEASEYVQLYVDNGKEWIPIKTYNGDVGGPNVDQSVKEIIDLSPYRSEEIRLIWEHSDGGWAWWVGLDNVKVVGEGEINDKCAKAITIDTLGKCFVYDNTNALMTDEFLINQPNTTGKIYYKWSPEVSGPYAFSTSGVFNDQLEIFSGNCTNPTLISTQNKDEYGFKGEQIYLDVVAGQNYILRISGIQSEFGLDRGTGCIKIEHKVNNSTLPPNELCSSAIPILVDTLCTSATNVIANLDGPLPIKNQRSRADIWYMFTPQKSGDFVFESNADFADVITLYEGNCNQLTEVLSDFSGQKLDIKNVDTGQTYFIQITGYFSLLEGKVCGRIIEDGVDSIPNPVCQQAIAIPINSPCSFMENKGAGFSGVKPKCDVYIADDVWGSFVAPSAGKVYVRVKSDFPHLVSVYEGNCTNLTSLFCSKNVHHCRGYFVIEALEPGHKYFLQIGAVQNINKSHSGTSCIEILDTIPVFQSLEIEVSQECQSRGAVKLFPTAFGGHGNYTFYGLGLETPVAGNETYVVEVQDEEGCIATATIQTQSCNDFGCSLVSVLQSKHVTCFGVNNGEITALVEGGLEPYQYIWSNGQNTFTAQNLEAGNYSVTVTDASGCEWVDNVQIYQPAKITSNATYTQPTCFGESNGAIETFVIGGGGSYTYLWSNGFSGSNLSEIKSGIYTLTITDNNGCTFVESLVLGQPAEININANTQNNTCFGQSGGSIFTEIKGGTGGYIFQWSNGSDTKDILDLPFGEYILTITDENMCQQIKSWNIFQTDSFVLTPITENLIITDTEDAFISFMFTGGTPPYLYSWYKNHQPFENNVSEIITREIGEYFVEVLDSLGCTFTSQVWVVTRTSTTDNETSGKWSIHPNPTNKEIYITSQDNIKLSGIKIIDVLGRTVQNLSIDIFNVPYKLDVSNLPSGTYTLVLRIDGKNYREKFVKVE